MTALGREMQWVAATQPWKMGANPGVISEVNAIHVKDPPFQFLFFEIFWLKCSGVVKEMRR